MISLVFIGLVCAISSFTGLNKEKIELSDNLLWDLSIDGADAFELIESLSNDFHFEYNQSEVRDAFYQENDFLGIAKLFTSIYGKSQGRKTQKPKGIAIFVLVKAAEKGFLKIE